MAVWDVKFVGRARVDYEPILKVLRGYLRVELHTFAADENAENNPFIEEIEKNGIEVMI